MDSDAQAARETAPGKAAEARRETAGHWQQAAWPADRKIRLGWHTDATEETQYILAGTGELRLEDGSKHQVGPGSVFVLPTPLRHDLANTGKETLRAVAFFAAAMFIQQFDNVMLPPNLHLLGTPNRGG